MRKYWTQNLAEASKKEIFLAAGIFVLYFLCLVFFPFFPCQRYDMYFDAPTMYENFYFYSGPLELKASKFELVRVYKPQVRVPVGRNFTFDRNFRERLSLDVLQTHMRGLKTRKLIPEPLCLKRVTWSSRPDGSFGPTLTERYWWDGKYVSDITAQKILCAAEPR